MGKNYGLCGNELVEFVGCAILHDNAIAEYIREEFNNDYTEAQKQNIVEMNEIGVAKIADIMSDFYNFDSERHIRFYFAAALHDVGKLIIPNGITLTFINRYGF